MGISAAANSENPPAAPQMPSTENNGSSMIIIDWNIAYLNSPEPKLEFLEEKIDKQPYIIILQEVIPSAFEAIKKHFEKTAQVEYSLNYRVPGKYDNRSRKLGIVIIMSQDFILNQLACWKGRFYQIELCLLKLHETEIQFVFLAYILLQDASIRKQKNSNSIPSLKASICSNQTSLV